MPRAPSPAMAPAPAAVAAPAAPVRARIPRGAHRTRWALHDAASAADWRSIGDARPTRLDGLQTPFNTHAFVRPDHCLAEQIIDPQMRQRPAIAPHRGPHATKNEDISHRTVSVR